MGSGKPHETTQAGDWARGMTSDELDSFVRWYQADLERQATALDAATATTHDAMEPRRAELTG